MYILKAGGSIHQVVLTYKPLRIKWIGDRLSLAGDLLMESCGPEWYEELGWVSTIFFLKKPFKALQINPRKI